MRFPIPRPRSVFPVLALALAAAPAAALPDPTDEWAGPIRIMYSDSQFFAPIHATLSKYGHVMLLGFQQEEEEPTSVGRRSDSGTVVLRASDLAEPLTNPVMVDVIPEPRQIDLGMQTVFPTPPYMKDTLFCSGHVVLPDGTLLAAGGLRSARNWTDTQVTNLNGGGGLPYCARWEWDPTLADLGTWSIVQPDMVGFGAAGSSFTYVPDGATVPMFGGPERYYPTVTLLPDGTALVISGPQILELGFTSSTISPPSVVPAGNLSVEIYDPNASLPANVFVEISTNAQTPPEIFNRDYTHSFVLPQNTSAGAGVDVVMIGEGGKAAILRVNGTSSTWSSPGPKRPVHPTVPNPTSYPDEGATTALLPIRLNQDFGYQNGAIIVAGGEDEYMNQFDVYDPATTTWKTWAGDAGFLTTKRHHPNTVLLPDGKVAIIAGHGPSGQEPSPNLLKAEYVDPRDGFSVQLGTASSYAPRGYHSTSLLLPDGRILVAGGREGGSGINALKKEKGNFEILSPPYLDASLFHPQIVSAPANMTYGNDYTLKTNARVHEVVLISLGSMTHSVDMNQRYVQIAIHGQGPQEVLIGQPPVWRSTITAPADSQIAPPGYYMLFAVRRQGESGPYVPSVAEIVHLQ